MSADDLISPPLSKESPLGSLSGWKFVLHCRSCGERSKLVDKIAASPAIYAKPLREIVGRFSCSGCGAKPIKMEAECVWAKAYLPPKTRIDLTWLLEEEENQEDHQQSLSG